jgi:hypothetical protein
VIILVEANARATNRMAATEKQAQGVARLSAANLRIWHAQRKRYWVVNAESSEFVYCVNDSKEAIQILIHTFIYDVHFVLLLMGNNNADIIGGVFVGFSESLKRSRNFF